MGRDERSLRERNERVTIEFSCEHCGSSFNVPDSYAGKSAKCKCGRVLTIPSPVVDLSVDLSDMLPDPSAVALPTDADSSFYAPRPSSKTAKKVRKVRDTSSNEDLDVPLGMAFLSILFTLSGLGYIAIGILFLTNDNLSRFVDERMGFAPILVSFWAIGWSIALIAGGVGLSMKRTWGWCITAGALIFGVVEGLFFAAMTMLLLGSPQMGLGPGLGAFMVLGVLLYTLNDEVRPVYNVTARDVKIGLGAGAIVAVISIAIFSLNLGSVLYSLQR